MNLKQEISGALMRLDLSLSYLRSRYLDGSLTPLNMVEALHAQMLAEDAQLDRHIWIHRLSLDALCGYAHALQGRNPADLPLYGIPFAIKDNIDLAGVPTTAACPEFAYTPKKSATVVQRLVDAGAIPVGKTNLDQFATGLVGVRSPYGACRNAFDPDYVSGGSSAGSAVSVALGLASFSLGTDTAGSGRVPAGFNNLVGLKPSCGRIPTTGVIPACRTLDVVSIFALTSSDAASVLAVAEGEDGIDSFAGPMPEAGFNFGAAPAFRFGVPRPQDLEFHGNSEGLPQFKAAVALLESLGGTAVEFDLSPFRAVAALLYEGPWVAERYAAIRSFIEAKPEALHPVTRAITEKGLEVSAPDTFAALYKLKDLAMTTKPVWDAIDFMVTPTSSTPYTIAEVEADPIRLNSNLGHYTNFVNLLDLSALAVPTGFLANGIPCGVTMVAPCGKDFALLTLAARLHAVAVPTVGATEHAPHKSAGLPDPKLFPSGQVQVAVCGAHLSGLPLNVQLTSRSARLVRTVASAPDYKLYALPGGPPFRPGMVRVDHGGAKIAMEVWEMPASRFGSFVAGIPSPLGIGTVKLEDGTSVQGFVCEAIATEGAEDITHHGGWRAFIASRK
jgi:allophanate hydrolase